MHFLGEGLRECVSAPHPEARYSCYFPAYVLGTLIPNDSFFPLQGRVSCFFFIARASLRSVLKKLAPPLIRKGIVLSIILSIHPVHHPVYPVHPVYPSCLSSCLSILSIHPVYHPVYPVYRPVYPSCPVRFMPSRPGGQKVLHGWGRT